MKQISNKQKKFLILGGIALSKEIAKYAKLLNFDVYVADYLKDSPAKKIADKSFLIDALDTNAISELIKTEKIDGILTGFVDLLLPYYYEICRKTGLFYYGTNEQFKILHDKVLFKNLCKRHNIPVVEEYEINSIDDEESINNLHFPVLLKPVDNSGGRGITICHNVSEFKNNYLESLKFSKSKKILIERYMQSKEVTIFYILKDGEIKLSAMGDRHIKHFSDDKIPLPVAYTFPSIHLKKYEKDLNDKVINMFKSIGLRNGMIFIQSFIENGECVIYEMGYRLTGSLEYNIIEHASGYNPLQMMVEQAVFGKTYSNITKLANPYFKNKYCNITFLINPGTIKKIEGVEQIKKISNVLDLFLSYEEGDEIPFSAKGTLAQVVARVFAFAPNYEELTKTIELIHSKFKVISTDDENMLLPTFDTKEFLSSL